MPLDQEPKNVQAILKWYEDRHMESQALTFKQLVSLSRTSPQAEAFLALALQGFEAGREFQKVHPTVRSGIDYMPT